MALQEKSSKEVVQEGGVQGGKEEGESTGEKLVRGADGEEGVAGWIVTGDAEECQAEFDD